MKSISVLIILVYILLPAVCLAHPIELQAEVSSDIFDTFTSDHPDKQGVDNCKFNCCCTEYTISVYPDINTFAPKRLPGQSLYIKPPQIFIPIFVPPQNLS